MKKLTLMFSLLCASACSHAMPSPAADRVVLLHLRQPQGCTSLGLVEGVASGSLGYGDSLDIYAENDLKNHAAQQGATHVVVTDVTPSAHESRSSGEAYRCPQGAELR